MSRKKKPTCVYDCRPLEGREYPLERVFPPELAARIRAAGPGAVAMAGALAWHLEEGEPPTVRRPEDAFLLVADMAALEREEVRAIFLAASGQVIAVRTIFVGGVNAAFCRPREIFREALLHNAVSLIVAHNHPSGNPEPSDEDIEVTRRLVRAGEILEVEVLDHLIVARGGWISLRRWEAARA